MNGEAIFTEYLLPLTGLLIIVALVATVIGFLMSIITDPKSAVTVLVTMVGLVVLFFIGYSMADSSVSAKAVEKGVDASLSQYIGGVLNLTYYLFAISVVAIVIDAVQRVIKSIG